MFQMIILPFIPIVALITQNIISLHGVLGYQRDVADIDKQVSHIFSILSYVIKCPAMETRRCRWLLMLSSQYAIIPKASLGLSTAVLQSSTFLGNPIYGFPLETKRLSFRPSYFLKIRLFQKAKDLAESKQA